MPKFHPILYSVRDGAAVSATVEAGSADEACRRAASVALDLPLPHIDRLLLQRELEVIAVLEGEPRFAVTHTIPRFPER